ncbi:MAG: Asp-tRNA(Asn)/Glu-tRNA(Gln) amidotransferase subunit GatA [bacterium]|nr:Asp-tRNA(Asn)/Glu-tRNA(Gln) amidotransferase subunit GatA [bacterium]
MKLTDLTITQAKDLLNKKEISAVELTKAYIDNMEKYRGLNAFVTETPEMALEQAKASDERIASGNAKELDGIPMAIKDLYCTKGVRTTASSKMLENFVPEYESTVSRKLLEAGITMLGKTSMDEFAMGSTNLTSYFGEVKNPYKRNGEDLVPGGSSGGSASAVASGCAMAATGSDTGGSIRQPSSFCGLVGMKPTYGRASRYGMVAFSSSLDCPGPITRTVADSALFLKVISGLDEKDPTTAPKEVIDWTKVVGSSIKGLRIGIPEEYKSDKLNPEVQKLWDERAEDLKKLGAEIVNVSLPHTKYSLPVYYIIAPAEASSNLSRYDGVKYGYRTNSPYHSLDEMYELTRTEGFGAEVKKRLLIGSTILTEEFYERSYLKALKTRRIICNEFEEAFKKVDVILTPSTTGAAFSKNDKLSPLEVYLNDIYTVGSSLAGLPSMSIPVGKDKNGLPLGLQVMGRKFDEETVYKVASQLELISQFDNTPSKVMGE